jgi:hypothetical protein
MDLAERIEKTRFLGQEFLVWLWFKTELFEGTLTTSSGRSVEAWLDTQLVLESVTDSRERTILRGAAPSASHEAKLALLCGKLPLSARVCLGFDNRDFAFVFDARSFSMGSVALPELVTEVDDERFDERMQLLDGLFEVWYELYLEFLELRRSMVWKREYAAALVAWARGDDGFTKASYRSLSKRATRT